MCSSYLCTFGKEYLPSIGFVWINFAATYRKLKRIVRGHLRINQLFKIMIMLCIEIFLLRISFISLWNRRF